MFSLKDSDRLHTLMEGRKVIAQHIRNHTHTNFHFMAQNSTPSLQRQRWASLLWYRPVPGYSFHYSVNVCSCARMFIFEIADTYFTGRVLAFQKPLMFWVIVYQGCGSLPNNLRKHHQAYKPVFK